MDKADLKIKTETAIKAATEACDKMQHEPTAAMTMLAAAVKQLADVVNSMLSPEPVAEAETTRLKGPKK